MTEWTYNQIVLGTAALATAVGFIVALLAHGLEYALFWIIGTYLGAGIGVGLMFLATRR